MTSQRPRRGAISTRGKLWGSFFAELLLLIAPLLLGLLVGLMGAWQLAPAAIALGVLLTLPLRYPLGASRPGPSWG